VITLISNLGPSAVSGQFVGLPEGSLIVVNSVTYVLSYKGGADTQDVVLTATALNATFVNQAPSGTDKTLGMLENSTYTFGVSDFGFADPNNSPPNTFLAVKITTVAGAGSLTDNGVAVSAGQFVSVSDINAGKLLFTPASNGSGTPYTNFAFQVQDNGGTANGGVDTDPSPKTMT